MYLTEIDPKSGFLIIDKEHDGILAIKEFRDILDDKKLGLPCLTAIALTADYQSPVKYYNDKDRPRKAMEEATGNRDAFDWKIEVIQKALVKYDALQYDPTLEEGRIHYQRKVSKLKEFKESEEKFGKGIKDKNGKEILFRSPSQCAADLRKINEDIKEYEKQIQGKDTYSESPVRNGYALSRLEQKIEKKNSFYHLKR
jgi:hypothetical protein